MSVILAIGARTWLRCSIGKGESNSHYWGEPVLSLARCLGLQCQTRYFDDFVDGSAAGQIGY